MTPLLSRSINENNARALSWHCAQAGELHKFSKLPRDLPMFPEDGRSRATPEPVTILL